MFDHLENDADSALHALLYKIIRELLQLLPKNIQPPHTARKLLPVIANPNMPPEKKRQLILRLFEEEFKEDACSDAAT